MNCTNKLKCFVMEGVRNSWQRHFGRNVEVSHVSRQGFWLLGKKGCSYPSGIFPDLPKLHRQVDPGRTAAAASAVLAGTGHGFGCGIHPGSGGISFGRPRLIHGRLAAAHPPCANGRYVAPAEKYCEADPFCCVIARLTNAIRTISESISAGFEFFNFMSAARPSAFE